MTAGEIFVGLMSGSSCDGLDGVVLRIEAGSAPRWEVVAHHREPYPDDLGRRLRELPAATSRDVCRLDRELAERAVDLVERLLSGSGSAPWQVQAIGWPGHTACHLSPPESPRTATLQLGSGAYVAQRTGIPTVSDFRSSDLAAGGQGAPLVPVADEILLERRASPDDLVLVNLGGISNVTFLCRGGGDRVAFDVGPGCMLLDALASRATGGELSFDRDGHLAARGVVVPEVLDHWPASPFFALEPPRTASREDFGEHFLEATVARLADVRPVDLLRTAVELTCRSVRQAVERWIAPRSPSLRSLWLAGGGARHPHLREGLETLFTGWDVALLEERMALRCEEREAAAFAVLARETLAGRPGNWPEATGASRAVVLGSVSDVTRGR